MDRLPFDPPYTKEDLPQLDRLHRSVGLDQEWLTSTVRQAILEGEKEE
jgi:hypothetical protein